MGTHVYPWLIHVNVWQNQYSIVKQNKVKKKNVWGSLVAQIVKNLPAMWETQVQFLGWEDPLEKGTAAHSSVLAWRIPQREGYIPWGHKESHTT